MNQSPNDLPARLREIFSVRVPARLKEYAAPLATTRATLKFQATGQTPCSWVVHLDGTNSRVEQGDRPADCTFIAQGTIIADVASGRLNAIVALQDGRMQVRGDMQLLQKLKYIL